MRNRSLGSYALVVVVLLLQACSSSSHQTGWMYSTLDPGGGDRFTWQDHKSQIELVAKPPRDGVVVTKINPEDLWGLRQGDILISVDKQQVHNVREFLGDLHTLNGADAMATLKRDGVDMSVRLRGADYRRVLPPPIAPGDSMAAGGRESSKFTRIGVQ